MFSRFSPHTRALLQALFVTFLWSTSWILIKVGLKDIPPLTFAGLRYSLAFLCLCPVVLASRSRRSELQRLRGTDWVQLLVLGLIYIAITQGAQFIALSYLPATTLTLLINLSVVIIALLGSLMLAERLGMRQWGGIAIFFVGVILYFFPVDLPAGERLGLLAAGVVVLANSISAVLGRRINRSAHINPIIVTFVSIGIGAAILLVVGIAQSGWPQLAFQSWLLILWLAAVNTAFAFSLWNNALRTLSAVESGIINNTMLIQIAVLAWVFLGERLSLQEVAGLGAVAIGVLLVQFKGTARKSETLTPTE
ncbi:MAG: DMT family transporter [Anaerolineae bacterium]|nr:DMT family transporter [Anaerolineae bacterium]